MSKTVLTDARIFAGVDDLTGHSSSVELSAEYEALSFATFGGGGWRQRVAGVASSSVKASGFLDRGAAALEPDAGVFAVLESGEPVHLTVCPTGDEGDVAYLVPKVFSSWATKASHGALAAWDLEAASDGALVRGLLLADDNSPRVASADLDGFVVGAVADGGRLSVALHVLYVSAGASVTVAVESAASGDTTFASPTERVAFTAATAKSAQHADVAGPVTDTRYRAVLTITGPSPPLILLAVAAGVTPS